MDGGDKRRRFYLSALEFLNRIAAPLFIVGINQKNQQPVVPPGEYFRLSYRTLRKFFTGERERMSVVGNWQLYISVGFTDTYFQYPIEFKTDGTFFIGGAFGESGVWSSHDGQIMFQFDDPVGSHHTTYSGDIAGSAMVGIGSVFDGHEANWYATKTTIVVGVATEHSPHRSPSGKSNK